jgi:ATP adenylyltransferase
MTNLSQLHDGERRELTRLIEKVTAGQSVFGGDVFAFEHGSGHQGSPLGCGVDQAHLHLVPLGFDLIDAVVSDERSDLHWQRFDKIMLTDLPREEEYIAAWRAKDGGGVLATVQNPVSQWMRRFIAKSLGVGADWNYRTEPQLKNIRATVEVLRPTK